MKPSQFLLLIIVLVLAVLSAKHFLADDGQGGIKIGLNETAFERVMRTNTIRCGYYIYPPVTYRDANTGKLSGFTVDMMEAIAAKSGLTVEWTQEVTFGTWAQDLQNKRFDVACTPNWPTTALGRVVQFGKPMFYALIYPLGREGDTRFKTLADLNKPEVKISVHEANEIYYLVKEVLPNATLVALQPNADGTLPIMEVVNGKADVLISDKNAIAQWNEQNPDQKIAVAVNEPMKVQAFDLAVAAGEADLMAFLDNAVSDMLATNALPRLMDKWMPHKGIYLPPAKVYQE